jgi:hypothetical protein
MSSWRGSAPVTAVMIRSSVPKKRIDASGPFSQPHVMQ